MNDKSHSAARKYLRLRLPRYRILFVPICLGVIGMIIENFIPSATNFVLAVVFPVMVFSIGRWCYLWFHDIGNFGKDRDEVS